MAGGDHGQESNSTPEPVEKGFATLTQLQYVQITLPILGTLRSRLAELTLMLM